MVEERRLLKESRRRGQSHVLSLKHAQRKQRPLKVVESARGMKRSAVNFTDGKQATRKRTGDCVRRVQKRVRFCG